MSLPIGLLAVISKTPCRYLRTNTQNAETHDPRHIRGNLMAQYLLAIMGGGGNPFFGPLGMPTGDGPGAGRMGDYVFTQEGRFWSLNNSPQ